MNLATPPTVRGATELDRPAIEALLAPEIKAGTVLFREVHHQDFIVAEEGGRLLGAVAISPWSHDVAELGSLVSAAPGRGVGVALVEALRQEAQRRGYRSLVALTSIPGFFERAGFLPQARTPHALARAERAPRLLDASLEEAIDWKAQRCAACPRLGGCQQSLLRLSLTQAQRACA